jgi:drug/metabolite transporter (DMT)-like permease
MSPISLILILFSAVLHVAVHLVLKRARNRTAFIWWMWFWAALLTMPVVVLYWQSVPAMAWGIMCVSAVFDTWYYRSITKAYQAGDLSVVYPLSRGTAPVLILLWSLLFLKESPTAGGVGGIVIIAAGLYLIQLPQFGAWRESWQALGGPAARWALVAGLCISLYTTVDKVGVSYLAPLLYTCLNMAVMLVCLTPGTLRAVGWSGLVDELRNAGFITVGAGLAAISAYAIVLYAMKMGLPASYAGAVREISVVFGTITGIVLLKEPGTLLRILGAGMIAAGSVTIALLG